MSEREEFEAAYAKRAKCKITDLIAARWGSNGYRDPFVAAAWFGFIDGLAARTAPAEPVAWRFRSLRNGKIGRWESTVFAHDARTAREDGDFEVQDLYTAPDALQAEVERLSNALEVEKRSVENEVKRRNQYAQESDELDRQVEALKADAERYRWLRGKRRNNIVVRNGVSHLFDELLDRSIDAARTAKPEVKS